VPRRRLAAGSPPGRFRGSDQQRRAEGERLRLSHLVRRRPDVAHALDRPAGGLLDRSDRLPRQQGARSGSGRRARARRSDGSRPGGRQMTSKRLALAFAAVVAVALAFGVAAGAPTEWGPPVKVTPPGGHGYEPAVYTDRFGDIFASAHKENWQLALAPDPNSP